MTTEQVVNDVETTLAVAANEDATEVQPSSEAGWPDEAQFRIRIGNEIMLVTGGVGSGIWEVERAAEPCQGLQLAEPHFQGDKIEQVLTVGGLTKLIVDGIISDADLEALIASKQPLDLDLTEIAKLATTTFGRNFLTLADASAAKSIVGASPAYPSSTTRLRELFRSSDVAAIEAPSTGALRAYRKLAGDTDLYEAEELFPLVGLPGGFAVNQAYRRFSSFPASILVDSSVLVAKTGAWTNKVEQAGAPFGTYSYTLETGGKAVIKRTGKRLAVGIVTASNGGVWLPVIDGSHTAATLCQTVQELVTAGRLPENCLKANGGTLEPNWRAIDCYGPEAAYNNLIGLAEFATYAEHEIEMVNSGYKNPSSSANRCYVTAFGAQEATTSILTAGAAMAVHRFFLTSYSSAKEYATEIKTPGQPAAQFVGNVHGCEIQASIAVAVDGLTVVPAVLGGLVIGQQVEIKRVTTIKKPGGTGIIANASANVTALTFPAAFAPGDKIYGYGIPEGTVVESVNAGAGTMVLSKNATRNATCLLVTDVNVAAVTTTYRYGAEGIETRVAYDCSAAPEGTVVSRKYVGMDPVDATFNRADLIAAAEPLHLTVAASAAGAKTLTVTNPASTQINAGQHLLVGLPGLEEEVIVESVNKGVITLTAGLKCAHAEGTPIFRATYRLTGGGIFYGQLRADGAYMWAPNGLATMLHVPDPDVSVWNWVDAAPLYCAVQDRLTAEAPLTKAYITIINTGVAPVQIGPKGQTRFDFTSLRAGALFANPDQVLTR